MNEAPFSLEHRNTPAQFFDQSPVRCHRSGRPDRTEFEGRKTWHVEIPASQAGGVRIHLSFPLCSYTVARVVAVMHAWTRAAMVVVVVTHLC